MWYLKMKRTGINPVTVFHDESRELIDAYREESIQRANTSVAQRSIEWTAIISSKSSREVQGKDLETCDTMVS